MKEILESNFKGRLYTLMKKFSPVVPILKGNGKKAPS